MKVHKPYLEQYNTNGYVIVPEVLDSELVAEMREHIEWLERKYPDRNETGDHNLVQHDPFWLRLVSDPRLLDIAEQFIGPNIALFASSYFTKKPFNGLQVLWHQDGVYWPLVPMEVTSLWLAVDDSTPENGCLRVIPGTHKMDLKEMLINKDVPNALESQIDPRYVNESQAVNLVLKAGDVSIHHPNIIHGSNTNYSPNRRCGLTIRYIPTTTRITQQPWTCQFLLRGNPVEGINEYMPFPKYTDDVSISFIDKEKT